MNSGQMQQDTRLGKDTWRRFPAKVEPKKKIGKLLHQVRYTRFSFGRMIGLKGSPKVIEELNKALREELTAINQYFLHAEMCENWGYEKLSEYIKKQSIGEMKHAEALMERILFLDGSPSMKPLELTVGKNVQDMLQSDLDLELGAVKDYNAAIHIAVAERDNGSRDLFVMLLKDEEDHVDWLEAQIHQIKELGYERYLTMQMGEDEEE
jgi:bacterioferritin